MARGIMAKHENRVIGLTMKMECPPNVSRHHNNVRILRFYFPFNTTFSSKTNLCFLFANQSSRKTPSQRLAIGDLRTSIYEFTGLYPLL
jgi:hypothetical protein